MKAFSSLLITTICCFSVVLCVPVFDESPGNGTILTAVLTTNITLKAKNVTENETVVDREHGGVFATQFIDDGQVEKGRELTEVKGLPGANEDANKTKSFSGYLTVNKKFDSNIFFWFFPAKNLTSETPLILWLQGGPGAPSTFGIFLEVGPFQINKEKGFTNTTLYLSVSPRNYSWTDKASLLFFDQPVGTGFSFTGNDKGYAKSQEDCARDLYEALTQFFKLFPDQQNRSFFIFGESYGGKYAPSLGEKIVQEGEKAKKRGINLKGIAIGNGLCDPIRQIGYGVNLYQVGLINELQLEEYQKIENEAKAKILEGKNGEAFDVVNKIMVKLNGNTSMFTSTTGLKNYFNHQVDGPDTKQESYKHYIVQPSIQKAVHARENRHDLIAPKVVKYMRNDMMYSVKNKIEYILDQDIPMLFFNGNLDLIIPTSFTSAVLHALEWKGAGEFRKAERVMWRLKKDSPAPDGYIQKARNLMFQTVRKGGHMLPADLPETSYVLMSQFLDQHSDKQI